MSAMQDYEGKNVFVSLKTNAGKRCYSGKIIEVIYLGDNPTGSKLFLLTMIDRTGSMVSFSNTEVEVIDEEVVR